MSQINLEKLERVFKKYAEQRSLGYPSPADEDRMEAERRAYARCAAVVADLREGMDLDDLERSVDVDLEAAKQLSGERLKEDDA